MAGAAVHGADRPKKIEYKTLLWAVLYIGDNTKQLPDEYIRYRQAQMYGIPTEDLDRYSAEIVERDWWFFNEEQSIRERLRKKKGNAKSMGGNTKQTDLNSFMKGD